MAITHQYNIIRITRKDHKGVEYYLYDMGWGKLTRDPTEAKCYSSKPSIKRIMDKFANERPELLHVTMTIKDANDIVEEAFGLNDTIIE